MATNKTTDTNTNLHLSMLADQSKLVQNIDNKVSVDINSPKINEVSETSDSDNLVIDNFSNDSEQSKNSNNQNNIEINNLPTEHNHQSDTLNDTFNKNTVNTHTNIDASRFNINPDTIPYERLDDNAKKFKKMEKLAKLIELRNKGFNLTKNYSMECSYHEMCFEINHWTNYQTKKDGVELGKSFFMNAVTAMEFLNERYDPFGFKLNGWSEQVKVNSDSYTDVFGELYDKYKYTGKKVEPEIKLLLMLTASAVTFHTSKSLTDNMPGIPAEFLNNSNIMNSINTKINNSINGDSNENNSTFNTKQQELFNTVKNQMNNPPNNINQASNIIPEQPENKKESSNIKNLLNNLKNNNFNDDDDSSSISVSSSITLGSDKKKNILKINTK